MGLFNWFGEQEHNVFDYKPIYYDKEKEERRRIFGSVDGSAEGRDPRDAKSEDKEKTYVPGSYLKGSLRDGNYQRTRSHSNRAQSIIGIIGLLLVFIVLFYIAKFYTIL